MRGGDVRVDPPWERWRKYSVGIPIPFVIGFSRVRYEDINSEVRNGVCHGPRYAGSRGIRLRAPLGPREQGRRYSSLPICQPGRGT